MRVGMLRVDPFSGLRALYRGTRNANAASRARPIARLGLVSDKPLPRWSGHVSRNVMRTGRGNAHILLQYAGPVRFVLIHPAV